MQNYSPDNRELGIQVVSLRYDMETSLPNENLYSQETDFAIIHSLLPFITRETFLDVGAEKGQFAQFLVQQGFEGTLFEPCPKHHPRLQELIQKTHTRFFPYAIDAVDRQADFYLNFDDNGDPTDYFHSLQYLANDSRVKHQKTIQVTCRSLQSLCEEGVLEKHIGILKIDTEGNDLQVLKGIGDVRPQVLICEFFTKGIYAGWEEGDPYGLIAEAEKIGFTKYLAIKRRDAFEMISIGPAVFSEKEWGNLIFLNDTIYDQAFQNLQHHVLTSEKHLLTVLEQQKSVTEQKEHVIQTQHKELDAKEKAIEAQQREQATKDALIDSQHQELLTKEELIESLRAQFAEKEEVIQAQQREQATKDTLIESQHQELLTKAELIESLRAQFTEKEEVIQAQQREQATKDTLIDSQHQELLTKEELIESLRAQFTEKEELIQAQQREQATKDALIESQHRELTAKEERSQELQDELVTKEEQIISQQKDLDTQETLAAEQQQRIQQQKSTLAAQQETIQSQEEHLRSLQQTLTAREQVIASHHEELAAKEEFIQSQHDKLLSQEHLVQSQFDELVAKEQVIQKLLVFRWTSLRYWFLTKPYDYLRTCFRWMRKSSDNSQDLTIRPERHTDSVQTQLSRKVASLLTLHPKLEQFHQYDPVPLNIPSYYHTTTATTQQALPRVSIVTPSFNHAQFLERTMKSVLEQKYPNLEYLVQDGASTDETTPILERYRSQLAYVESCKDTGQANAINLGFRHATGDIMAWLNSDDILLPGTVAYIVNFFLKHPEVDVVYGHRIMIDEHDQEIGRGVLPPHDDTMLLWADYVPQETLFWRRGIWEKAGGHLNESYHFVLDWDLLLRFHDAGATFVRLPRFLAAFRVHSQQKTSLALNDVGHREMTHLRQHIHGHNVSPHEIRRHIRYYRLKHLIYDRLYRWRVLRGY